MSAAAERGLYIWLNKILPLTLKRQNLNRNSVAAAIKMQTNCEAKWSEWWLVRPLSFIVLIVWSCGGDSVNLCHLTIYCWLLRMHAFCGQLIKSEYVVSFGFWCLFVFLVVVMPTNYNHNNNDNINNLL